MSFKVSVLDDPGRFIVDTWLSSIDEVRKDKINAFILDLSVDVGAPQFSPEDCFTITKEIAHEADTIIRLACGQIYPDLIVRGV